MHRIVTLSFALAGIALFASVATGEEKEARAIPLFNGRDLAGWEFFAYQSKAKMADVWSVKDGLLICRGQPIGYISTKRKFKDFRLIVEWRWAPGQEPGNSGVLLRITGRPVSFLPKCLEAQLKSGSAGDIWAFHGFKCQGATDRFKTIKGNKQLGDFLGVGKIRANENPPGQWNQYDITLRGGNLTLAVNGKKTNEATGCDQVAGRIGLQSEGARIHFRTVKLIPLEGKESALPGTAPLTLTADTPWVIAPKQPEPVERALDDVKADWYKVFGHAPIVLAEPPKSWSGPVVYLGMKGPWLKELVKEPLSGAESFVLRVQKDSAGRSALVATGSDVRGTIYAAYALSEEILGVDPWYYWVDKEPVKRKQIEVPADLNKKFGPPTFKYRGWFINDEDLLAGFAPDPLRENIYSLEMADRIYETLLRLRGNMIVPGTFLFPDERVHELAARRGLAINMHHILVVGLNTYRWPKDVPFSYSKHPEIMERYWQTCIDSFKDKEVVWTVGYRGKHDRPFWKDEPHLKTPAERGAWMSRAVAKQVELIRKVQPRAAIITNLWMEGAKLYQQGHFKLPEGVTIIWADQGTGIIRDGGQVQAGQGIYYHTAMLSGAANQLSELVNPGRIYDEVGRFTRAGATKFFLVNVSDIRPVPLSTDCAMKFIWNAEPYLDKSNRENMDSFLLDWSRRQFGPKVAPEVASIYNKYFAIPYMRRSIRRGENIFYRRWHKFDKAIGPLIAQGKPLGKRWLARTRGQMKKFYAYHPYVAELAAEAETLASRIPDERKPFYQSHILTPIHIHLHSLEMWEAYTRALEAYEANDKSSAASRMEAALKANGKVYDALHKAEYGKWSDWYRGESFVGLDYTRDRLRSLLASLRGQTPPPVRFNRSWRGATTGRYSDLYRYQEPFAENFPLLYPTNRQNTE